MASSYSIAVDGGRLESVDKGIGFPSFFDLCAASVTWRDGGGPTWSGMRSMESSVALVCVCFTRIDKLSSTMGTVVRKISALYLIPTRRPESAADLISTCNQSR